MSKAIVKMKSTLCLYENKVLIFNITNELVRAGAKHTYTSHTDSRYSDLEHVHCVVSGQESHVSRALEFAGDIDRCLDFSNCDDTIAGLLHCISDQLGSLSISFGAENIGDNFLFFAFDVEFLLLSVLLGNLLLFNSVHEINSELHVRQRHIVDDNVVFEGTLLEHLSDFLRNFLSQRNQLLSRVLSGSSFEHFLRDLGQEALGVIGTEIEQDSGKLLLDGSKQNSHDNDDLLHIFGVSFTREHLWLCAHLESLNLISERKLEMHAFTINLSLKTFQIVLDDNAVTWLNNEDEVAEENTGAEHAEAKLANPVEESLHFYSRLFFNYNH